MRIKKFLMVYILVIVCLIVCSALGIETWDLAGRTAIEMFLQDWQTFVGATILCFIISLFF